jgi:hypothetical protein
MKKIQRMKESISHVKGDALIVLIHGFLWVNTYAFAVRILKLKIHISLVEQKKYDNNIRLE